MIEHTPFAGVISPVLTPFEDDLSVSRARFVDLCQRQLEEGCTGLAIFGTTSEANSLSIEEKIELLAALGEAGIDPAKLMPGTGTCALPDTVKLTRAAVEAGCGGVLLLPPFYYKTVSEEGLFRSAAETIERVGDERLQVYLYHFPQQAVIGWSVPLIERLVKAYPKTIVGLKDSSGDLDNMKAVLKAVPGFGVFTGTEIHTLSVLRAGGAGTITASANVNAPAIRHLYDNWEGPRADELQAGVTAFRKALQSFPPIPAMKEMLARRFDDPTWRNTRPPLTAMSAEAVAELHATMEPLAREQAPA